MNAVVKEDTDLALVPSPETALAAKEAFMAGGFDEEQARTIVRLIKADQIPGISIAY